MTMSNRAKVRGDGEDAASTIITYGADGKPKYVGHAVAPAVLAAYTQQPEDDPEAEEAAEDAAVTEADLLRPPEDIGTGGGELFRGF